MKVINENNIPPHNESIITNHEFQFLKIAAVVVSYTA
jgi:hypothetical protein